MPVNLRVKRAKGFWQMSVLQAVVFFRNVSASPCLDFRMGVRLSRLLAFYCERRMGEKMMVRNCNGKKN